MKRQYKDNLYERLYIVDHVIPDLYEGRER